MELQQLFTKMKLEHLESQIDSVCEQAAQARTRLQELPRRSPGHRVAGPPPQGHRGAP